MAVPRRMEPGAGRLQSPHRHGRGAGSVGRQRGFSAVELLLAGLAVMMVIALIVSKFKEAAVVERRVLAQQALITAAGLQERWFVRMYEYAPSAAELGGADAAGEDYTLRVTHEPCGTNRCFTIWAKAINRQAPDEDCQQFGINSMGVRFALAHDQRDTTRECWSSPSGT